MIKARVLLADKDRSALQKLSAMLRNESFDVTEAVSISAARRSLAQEEFDLAIIDLQMEHHGDDSDLSGLSLAKSIQEKLPSIVLAGQLPDRPALLALASEVRATPVISFMDKFGSPDVLLEAIRRTVRPKVLVSHGRDRASVAEVVRFLEDGGAQVVVIRDQPQLGQALLERLERHSNVQFAVVLLTPDDEGAQRGGIPRLRARQNVILELGLMIAKLGRERVAILKAGNEDMELPSYFHDALYRVMDDGGGWRIWLAREMKEVEIDLRLV